MLVVYTAPGAGLRLRGALGPLQAEGVDGTLSWTLKPVEGGTNATLSYVVGGYIRTGMEQWAPRVDRVLDEQLQRLKGLSRGIPRPDKPDPRLRIRCEGSCKAGRPVNDCKSSLNSPEVEVKGGDPLAPPEPEHTPCVPVPR